MDHGDGRDRRTHLGLARNRVHKTLDHDGLRLGGVLSDIFGVNGRRVLNGLVAERSPRCILAGLTSHVRAKLAPLSKALAATLDPLALFALQMQVEAVDRADAALAALDTRIQTALADYQRPLRLLQTIPGIDLGSASTILVEIGPDLGAFREARHLGSWAGVAPGNNTSAGKRRSGRARPGNPTLRATLAECAHAAARTTGSQFHGYHRALAARLGYKRAILATAHKLLRVIHAVLRDDRPLHRSGHRLRTPRRRTQRTAVDPHAHAARFPRGSTSRARLTDSRSRGGAGP